MASKVLLSGKIASQRHVPGVTDALGVPRTVLTGLRRPLALTQLQQVPAYDWLRGLGIEFHGTWRTQHNDPRHHPFPQHQLFSRLHSTTSGAFIELATRNESSKRVRK